MTTQAGWHPDPSPGAPQQLRYWDGARWTEHTAPYPQQTAFPYPAAYAATTTSTTTPDGVPLAGWWQRVRATLFDGLILLPILAVLYIPFYGRIGDAYGRYFDRLDAASRSGSSAPSATSLQTDLLPTLALMSVISLALSLVWTFAWLRTRQATPGKLVVGLRVRPRKAPGPLTTGMILRRWLVQYGVQILALVPVVGSLVSFFSLLDVLWAAWDDKRQTLHDKAAGTNVVRVR